MSRRSILARAMTTLGLGLGVVMAGCTNAPAPAPTGSASVTATATSTASPSGRPVVHTAPLPTCAALMEFVPPGVVAPSSSVTSNSGADGWREFETCEVSGSIPGASSVKAQVYLERPLLDPVEGIPVAAYLASRPEQLMKQHCPDFPYAPVAEINHGFTCYLRISATQAQGLVVGATTDGAVMVTMTVSDPSTSPAQLRTLAETAARSVAIALAHRS